MFDYNPIIEFDRGKFIRIDVGLEPTFPLFFGRDIEDHFIDTLDRATRHRPVDRFFLLTDAFIFDLYGEPFFDKIQQTFPATDIHLLPRGETCKTFDVLQDVCDRLVAKGVSKRSLLIAFGGGSVGNITGLAAGLIFRGIRFVEVPTTITHQTDGMLSNKQAVNGKYGKNNFGIYHAPVFAWTDTRYTETEPLRFKRSGIIEGIKNGLIDQDACLPFLEHAIRKKGDYSSQQLTDLCFKLIRSKLEILKKDPTERRYGIILEYGHTFAHAIEWLAKGALTHGEAVSIGMKIAAELSLKLGYIDGDAVALHYRLIDDVLALRPRLPEHLNPANIFGTMYVDNKKIGSDVRYVLLQRIGQCRKENGDFLVHVDEKIVRRVIEEFFQNYVA
ncbi:3-dehydroquinate synthase [Desulfosarcina alkanivorans]|uniref:3-dehydroquinate synthase n=1 Tax=Desulfosarcina alkanivorans TaxID=571177 RepID=A0A5K7YH29_9BACT|nr:3-dehydroquinate synthase [Desulfosarcina alkanivorans]BBO68922.1 3-dehydroquinate synthase [Desulfosarcina alkanivorans]